MLIGELSSLSSTVAAVVSSAYSARDLADASRGQRRSSGAITCTQLLVEQGGERKCGGNNDRRLFGDLRVRFIDVDVEPCSAQFLDQ